MSADLLLCHSRRRRCIALPPPLPKAKAAARNSRLRGRRQSRGVVDKSCRGFQSDDQSLAGGWKDGVEAEASITK